MTVESLINRLNHMPQTLEVLIQINDEVYVLESVKVVQVLDDLGRLTIYLGPKYEQPGLKVFACSLANT